MVKFSDSSHYILSEYFDVLVTPRSGTHNSFIQGQKHTISAKGGLNTTLYQLNDSGDFSAFKFLIQELDGDNFVFSYVEDVSTHSEATSLEMGKEMYFRKDSLFHDWLRVHATEYEQSLNTNKTFIYFGKIYEISNSPYYNIIFEGMKNYVENALPENNRTTKIVELLKVFFDESYQDVYNMTKTLWSFFDAREVDSDHLNYLATRANVETDINKISSELLLREFVDTLPWWLKRKGTYSSYLSLFKLLLGNTKNKLNFFERWTEWCLRELREDDIIYESDYEDHHYLERYSRTPTGGSGPFYYNQFDYNNYPEYTDTAPANCLEKSITPIRSSHVQFTDWLETDAYDHLEKYTYNIQINGFNPASDIIYLYSTPNISGSTIRHAFTVSIDSTALPSGGLFVWAVSDHKDKTLAEHIADNENFLGVSFDIVGATPSGAVTDYRFRIYDSYNGTHYTKESSGAYNADTNYYVAIEKNADEMVVKTFNDPLRRDQFLIDRIRLPLQENKAYNTIYMPNYLPNAEGMDWTGDISNFYENFGVLNSIAPTGNLILSPHYRVEIDLSSEPMGDDYIISEDQATELVRYWDYLKPVSKFVHYNWLLSPIGLIDQNSKSIGLYAVGDTAFCNTQFFGQNYISGAPVEVDYGGAGDFYDNLFSEEFLVSQYIWVVRHNLGTTSLISQTFDSDRYQMWPMNHEYPDDNRLEMEWSQAKRGVAYVAELKPWNYAYTQSQPATGWNVIHNLGTSGASGVAFEIISVSGSTGIDLALSEYQDTHFDIGPNSGWVRYFGPSAWSVSGSYLTYNSSKNAYELTAGDGLGVLQPVGTWSDNYMTGRVRVTYTTSGSSLPSAGWILVGDIARYNVRNELKLDYTDLSWKRLGTESTLITSAAAPQNKLSWTLKDQDDAYVVYDFGGNSGLGFWNDFEIRWVMKIQSSNLDPVSFHMTFANELSAAKDIHYDTEDLITIKADEGASTFDLILYHDGNSDNCLLQAGAPNEPNNGPIYCRLKRVSGDLRLWAYKDPRDGRSPWDAKEFYYSAASSAGILGSGNTTGYRYLYPIQSLNSGTGSDTQTGWTSGAVIDYIRGYWPIIECAWGQSLADSPYRTVSTYDYAYNPNTTPILNINGTDYYISDDVTALGDSVYYVVNNYISTAGYGTSFNGNPLEAAACGPYSQWTSDSPKVSAGVATVFENINIAQGTTITSAYLKLYVSGIGTATGPCPGFIQVRARAVDDAVKPPTTGGTGGRPTEEDHFHQICYGYVGDNGVHFLPYGKNGPAGLYIPPSGGTEATVDWDLQADPTGRPNFTGGLWNRGYSTSPDISSIIQEIVDRPGWQSGNNIGMYYYARRSGLLPHQGGKNSRSTVNDAADSKIISAAAEWNKIAELNYPGRSTVTVLTENTVDWWYSNPGDISQLRFDTSNYFVNTSGASGVDYYFSQYGQNTGWESLPNLVDNLDTTLASAFDSNANITVSAAALSGSQGALPTPIERLFLQVYGKIEQNPEINLIPYFDTVSGSRIEVGQYLTDVPGKSPWVRFDNDPSAPIPFEQSDLDSLSFRIEYRPGAEVDPKAALSKIVIKTGENWEHRDITTVTYQLRNIEFWETAPSASQITFETMPRKAESYLKLNARNIREEFEYWFDFQITSAGRGIENQGAEVSLLTISDVEVDDLRDLTRLPSGAYAISMRAASLSGDMYIRLGDHCLSASNFTDWNVGQTPYGNSYSIENLFAKINRRAAWGESSRPALTVEYYPTEQRLSSTLIYRQVHYLNYAGALQANDYAYVFQGAGFIPSATNKYNYSPSGTFSTYYTSYDTGQDKWETNPESMVDGDLTTYAQEDSSNAYQFVQTFNNSYNTPYGRSIEGVFIRAHGLAGNPPRSWDLVPYYGAAGTQEVSGYFDNYDTGTAWNSNPANMVDGDRATAAVAQGYVTSPQSEMCTSNTVSDNGYNISKIELRAYGAAGGTPTNLYLIPWINGNFGDNYDLLAANFPTNGNPGGWSDWLDITNDGQGPPAGNGSGRPWNFDDIAALDVEAYFERNAGDGPGDTVYITKIEINISTYSATASGDRYRLKDYSIPLHDQTIAASAGLDRGFVYGLKPGKPMRKLVDGITNRDRPGWDSPYYACFDEYGNFWTGAKGNKLFPVGLGQNPGIFHKNEGASSWTRQRFEPSAAVYGGGILNDTYDLFNNWYPAGLFWNSTNQRIGHMYYISSASPTVRVLEYSFGNGNYPNQLTVEKDLLLTGTTWASFETPNCIEYDPNTDSYIIGTYQSAGNPWYSFNATTGALRTKKSAKKLGGCYGVAVSGGIIVLYETGAASQPWLVAVEGDTLSGTDQISPSAIQFTWRGVGNGYGDLAINPINGQIYSGFATGNLWHGHQKWTRNQLISNSYLGYSDLIDITNDSGAPATWTDADINNIEIINIFENNSDQASYDYARTTQIELLVQYSPTGAPPPISGATTISGLISNWQEVYENRPSMIFPKSAQRVDVNTLLLTFAKPTDGKISIRDDDYYHIQETASTIWNINHNLNIDGAIVQCYNENGYYIMPKSIRLDDENNTTITFAEAQAGSAVFIIFQKLFETGDYLSSFYGDPVGYWKAGDGGDEVGFNPLSNNDINSILTSGGLDSFSVTSSGASGVVLINFTVPKAGAYQFNEFGVFDHDKNLHYYTKCSDIYKPDGVSLNMRYRIAQSEDYISNLGY